MKNRTIDSNKCVGCGACILSCPMKCISYKQNEAGFYIAEIDAQKCIKCGKCTTVCPVCKNAAENNEIIDSYIAVNKNQDDYKKSSSGGLFSSFAKAVISRNGIVWGCGYSYDHNGVLFAEHKYVENITDLDDLCRSKYIQSNMQGVIATLKEQLSTGKEILFVGTPCQNAGIRNYFGEKFDNLILVDLFCHGVPSAKLFSYNLNYISEKQKSHIKRYEFRLKVVDSTIYHSVYMLENGRTIVLPYFKDYYYYSFYNNLSLNNICYECPYACSKRAGDLTIGDYFWGKKYHENFADYDELSCILVNTEKGKEFLESVKDLLHMEKTNIAWIKERNKTLLTPTIKPEGADCYYDTIEKYGYKHVAAKYFHSFDYLRKTETADLLRKIIRRLKR